MLQVSRCFKIVDLYFYAFHAGNKLSTRSGKVGIVPHKYNSIAVGGTFDQIHGGHRTLLKRAFDTSELVIIGLTSDAFAASEGKKLDHSFEFRRNQLSKYLAQNFPGREYTITKLEARFGKGIFTRKIEAIAVSTETFPSVRDANDKRRQLGLPEMKVEVVPLVVTQDGQKISSTRIRAGEIDEEGRPK